jgi:phosphohistidine phosphatase
MKYLTLIRHAKSDWNDSTQPDHERPLNDRGNRAAPLVGRFIGKTYLGLNGVPALLPQPDVLVSSTATRAHSTARLMLPELAMNASQLVLDERAYLAEPNTLLEIVHGFDDTMNHVMLFAHNPGISEFADQLLRRGEIEEMPTCAAAIIELPYDLWSAASWSEARLVGYITPKLIEKKFAGELTAAEA